MATNRIVAVAQKPRRGSTSKYPELEGFLRVDVTSGSNKKLGGVLVRDLLSPMLLRTTEGVIFENFWQYSKVYPGLGHLGDDGMPNDVWREWRRRGFALAKGTRTPPAVSRLRRRDRLLATPAYLMVDEWSLPGRPDLHHKPLFYIESRKEIYAPIYMDLILKNGILSRFPPSNLLILDVDGPPLEKSPYGVEIDVNKLRSLIEDPAYPFGHGYLVGAALQGIAAEMFCI